MDDKYFHDSHYVAMTVQPIEVMQELMPVQSFYGFLLGNAVKYEMRRGHKQGEDESKEVAKRDRYIDWMYRVSEKQKIDPKEDCPCPEWYRNFVLRRIRKKIETMDKNIKKN